MAITINDVYQKALDSKMLSSKVTLDRFKQMLGDDGERRKYYDAVRSCNPNFYSSDYEVFSRNAKSLLDADAAPAPSTTTAQPTAVAPTQPTAVAPTAEATAPAETESQEEKVTPTATSDNISDVDKLRYQSLISGAMQSESQIPNVDLKFGNVGHGKPLTEAIGNNATEEQQHSIGNIGEANKIAQNDIHVKRTTLNTLNQLKEDLQQYSADAKNEVPSAEVKLNRMVATDPRLGGIRAFYGSMTQSQKNIWAANQFIKNAEDIMNGAVNKEGFWRGLGKTLGKVDTWTAGLNELHNSEMLMAALKKYEEGGEEALTREESALLDASATYAAISAMYSDQLGRMYKAGQVTGESLPFMLEFMITPLEGAANGIFKGLAKWGSKSLGRRIVARSVQNVLVKAPLMTTVWGGPKIVSGAEERMAGVSLNKIDEENGRIVFDGTVGGQKVRDAVYNSFMDQYVENLSEMFFTPFEGVGGAVTSKVLAAPMLRSVNKAIGTITGSRAAQVLSRLYNTPFMKMARNRAYFGGYLEEVAEEEVGGLLRLAMNTDVNNLQQAGLDLDSQIDTFLGLAPTSIFFAGAGAVETSYTHARIPYYSNRILHATNTEEARTTAKDAINNILSDKELSMQQKGDALKSVLEDYRSRIAEDLAANEESISNEEKTAMDAVDDIDKQTNLDDGNIYRVSVTGEDGEWRIRGGFGYKIENGRIVPTGEKVQGVKMKNGTLVLRPPHVIVYKEENGEETVKMVDLDAVTILDTPVSAEEAKAGVATNAAADDIIDEEANKELKTATHTIHSPQGDIPAIKLENGTYQMLTPDGEPTGEPMSDEAILGAGITIDEVGAAPQAAAEQSWQTEANGDPAWKTITDPNIAMEAAIATAGGDVNIAISYISDVLLPQAKAELQAAEKAKMPKTNSMSEYVAAINNIKKAKEDAANHVKMLTDTLAALNARPVAPAAPAAPSEEMQTEIGFADGTMAERFKKAKKVVGNSGSLTLADGRVLNGKYVLIEQNGVTPSHDPNNGFDMFPGYPQVDGHSINDRDYKKNITEQNKVRFMGQNFNGQSLKNIPVISNEGLVYNGNGRTMAGMLAAQNGTDTAYAEQLAANAQNFGFSKEHIASVPHARVYFMLDENLPYNTSSLAIFNANETQTMSPIELAAAITRKMNAQGTAHIIAAIREFDTLDDFLKSNATFTLINQLISDGIISQSDKAAMMNGERLSEGGKEVLTAIMLGTAFSEEVVRILGDNAKVRANVVKALPQILDTQSLGEYSIFDEINNAIKAFYSMTQSGLSYDDFAKQLTIEGVTAASEYSEFELLLLSRMCGDKKNGFADQLEAYNEKARLVMGGQMDIFSGNVPTKQDIINQILGKYEEPKQEEPEQEEPAPAPAAEVVDAVPGNEGNGEQVEETTPPAAPAVDAPQAPVVDTPAAPAVGTDVPAAPAVPDASADGASAPIGSMEYFLNKNDGNKAKAAKAKKVWDLLNKGNNKSSTGAIAKSMASAKAEELSGAELQELIAAGADFAVEVINDGSPKFADYFKEMVDMFGDAIRPYVKAIYGQTQFHQDLNEEYGEQMDDRKTVVLFDEYQPINENEDDTENQTDLQRPEAGSDTIPVGGQDELPSEPGGVQIADGRPVGGVGTADGEQSDISGDDSPTEGAGEDANGGEGVQNADVAESDTAGSGGHTGSGAGGNRGGGRRKPGGRNGSTGRGGRTGKGGDSESGTPNGGVEEITAEQIAEAEKEAHDTKYDSIKDVTDTDALKAEKQLILADIEQLGNDEKLLRASNMGEVRAINDRLREIFADKVDVDLSLTSEKVSYIPVSDPEMIHSVGSVVPSGSANSMRNALLRVQEEVGKSIADYVCEELGYESTDEMFSTYSKGKDTGLSGEQVDAVALAIFQMKKGNGFIVGDMTGIGKGRTGAALIRWGKLHGKKVLFVTEKAQLFTDMYGDLRDIGTTNLTPMILNNNSDANIVDNNDMVSTTNKETGEVTTAPRVVVRHASPARLEELYDSNSDILPTISRGKKATERYDFVMSTYTQTNKKVSNEVEEGDADTENLDVAVEENAVATETKADQKRNEWLKKYAKDAIVIMDESHNASGISSGAGSYFQDIASVASGVTFMSATYAKRPDNMVIYTKRSSMSRMNITTPQLIEAVKNYGVPMQEIIAESLFRSGEMVRRERDFSGVNTTWLDPKEVYKDKEYEQARDTADRAIDVVNKLIDFQENCVQPVIDQFNEQWKEHNDEIIKKKGDGVVVKYRITGYNQQVSNVLNLVMYGLKSKKAAELAIEQIKQGKKPVIAVDFTNEAYIKGLEENPDVADFRSVLEKGLKFCLKYTEVRTQYKGGRPVLGSEVKTVHDSIYSEMDGLGKAVYAEAKEAIVAFAENEENFELPLSPIDFIKQMIEDAGYKCGEITGRKEELRKDEEGKWYKRPFKANKKDVARLFNGGTSKNAVPESDRYDAVVLNQAGATGISLHASSRFGDQRPRVMIIAQPSRDINTEVQMRGRIDRTGNVHRGEYFYLISPIPAEQKIALMLRKKLSSLDANSVGTENVSSNKVDMEDMDNQFGDEVVYKYLTEHLQDVNFQLKTGRLKQKRGVFLGYPGQLYDVMVGIQRFPTEKQDRILSDLQEEYNEKIAYIEQSGVNPLKSTTMNLDAKTIDVGIFVKGYDSESTSLFAHDTNVERMEVNVLTKPMPSNVIREEMTRLNSFDEDGHIRTSAHTAIYQVARTQVFDAITKKEADNQAKLDALFEKLKLKFPKAEDATEDEYNMLLQSQESYMKLANDNAYEYASFRESQMKKLESLKFASFIPGKPYLVPLTDDIASDDLTFARFLGFKYDRNKVLNVRAVFAVKDSRSKIEIPVANNADLIRKIIADTQHDTVYGVNEIEGYDYKKSNDENLGAWNDWWDSKLPKDNTRQIRYMITGNILQAAERLLIKERKSGKKVVYKQKYKGQVTTFTRKDPDTGEITTEKGMLLCENFDPETFMIRSKPDFNEIWNNGKQVTDSENKISARREYGELIIEFMARTSDEKIQDLPAKKDTALISMTSNGRPSASTRNMTPILIMRFSEENAEKALNYVYENYGFSKEDAFVMPDSTERVDAVIPFEGSFIDFINAHETELGVWSAWSADSEIKKLVKRYKLDVNNETLKEKIRKLVQLRQAYYMKADSRLDNERLAWELISNEQDMIDKRKDGDKNAADNAFYHFKAQQEELSKRGVSGNVYNFEAGDIKIKEVRKLFNKLNSNKDLEGIAKKVFDKIESINGMRAVFNETLHNRTGGQTGGHVLQYNWKFFSSGAISDQMKANTLLHEAVHTMAEYLRIAVQKGEELYLSDEKMLEKMKQLAAIYKAIKNDPSMKVVQGPYRFDLYGSTELAEMMTEVCSNEEFRNAMRNIPLAVQVSEDFGVRSFSFTNKNLKEEAKGKEVNALDAAMECMNYIIDNFEEKAFVDIWKLYEWMLAQPVQESPANETKEDLAKELMRTNESILQAKEDLRKLPIGEAANSETAFLFHGLNEEKKYLERKIGEEELVKDLLSVMSDNGIPIIEESVENANSIIAGENDGEKFITSNRDVYGWYENGEIHLVKDRINPNTIVHEYTHLWAAAMRNNQSRKWKNIVDTLKRDCKPIWDEVVKDPNYAHIKTDDAIASEVIARYSGDTNSKKLMDKESKDLEENQSISGRARVRTLYNKVRKAISDFWKSVADLFGINNFRSADEIADRVLYDLLNGTNLGPQGPGGGVREMQIIVPNKEEGESASEYSKRLKEVYDSFAEQDAVDEYTKFVNKEAGPKAMVRHIDKVQAAKNAVMRKLADAAEPLKHFEEYVLSHGGKKTESAYEDTFLSSGRSSTASEKFEREYIRPLAKTVAHIANTKKLSGLGIKWQNLSDDDIKEDEKKRKNGKELTPLELLGVYTQAKDCAEAAEKGLNDRGAEGFIKNLGMTHEDVIAKVEPILRGISIDGVRADKKLWQDINRATSFSLDYQLEHGLITPETRERFRRNYYVPQRGWIERDLSGVETRYVEDGHSYNQPYNAALKTSKGRTSLASNPIPYIMSIGNSSIATTERNRTKQKFLDFCLENEEIGLKNKSFRIDKFWVLQVMDETTGTAKLDSDGNPITEVSYAEPTAEMYAEDKQTRAEIEALSKQLGKAVSDKAKWDKLAKDTRTEAVIRAFATSKSQAFDGTISETKDAIDEAKLKLHIVQSVKFDSLKMRTKDEAMQHVVFAIKDGQKYAIFLRDEKLANAINKKYAEGFGELNKLERFFRYGTRHLSAWLTQFNPEFAASNFMRDYQVALATLQVEQGTKFAAQFQKNFVKVQRAVSSYAFNDKVMDREKINTNVYVNIPNERGGSTRMSMADLLKEYYEHGAQTGYTYLADIDVLRKDFDQLMRDNNIKKAIRSSWRILAVLTEISETATRFAAYVTARENGRSADDAAYLSKELTTNFDRGGELARSNWFALFSFFRATINGNLKFYRGFKNFAKGYTAVGVTYFLLGLANALLNPDDPDDDIWFTSYTRQSNLCLGGILGFTAKIPAAHFMRMFFAMGNNLGNAINGRKTQEEAVYDTMMFMAGEQLPNYLNPFSSIDYDPATNKVTIDPYSYIQQAMPSTIAPFVDVYINRDFTGRAINGERDQYKGSQYKKDILKYRKDTSTPYVNTANYIYEALGGDLNVDNNQDDNRIQSLVDISPSALEHVVEGYTPAMANTFISAYTATKAATSGENVYADEVPFVRKFWSSFRLEKAYNSEYWKLNARVEAFKSSYRSKQKGNEDKADAMRNSHMYDIYERADELIRELDGEEPTKSTLKKLMELNREWNLEFNK